MKKIKNVKYNPKGLRIERSHQCSGVINHLNAIKLLKEDDYYIIHDYPLDGNAPKQFIRAYFYKEDSVIRKINRSSWPFYIAKTAEKWYPHESIMEFMINRIGQILELNINEVELVIANGQIRFLSKYFKKRTEKLIHGAEICGQHLGDLELANQIANNKNTARELFTFEFIRDSIRSVFPNDFERLILDLVKMLVFDCIVGNNDRHFYNWGVIQTLRKTSINPTFAPIYDSARGLLWNFSDNTLKTKSKFGNKEIDSYIEQASPRISIDDNISANHFQLIDVIRRYNSEYNQIVYEMSDQKNEEKILKTLTREFYPFFIPERSKLITLILSKRFQRVRSFYDVKENKKLVF